MNREKITLEQAKDTGMALVLICLIGSLLAPGRFWVPVAIAVLVVTMTWPALFKPAARVWFGLSHALGTVVSTILLSILFFALVTPIGIIRRMMGADPMQLKKWGEESESGFVDRTHTYSSRDLEKPY